MKVFAFVETTVIAVWGHLYNTSKLLSWPWAFPLGTSSVSAPTSLFALPHSSFGAMVASYPFALAGLPSHCAPGFVKGPASCGSS